MSDTFPDFIKALPRPDAQFTIDAHIVPSDHALTMFYSVEVDTVVPMHSHGPQWGVVLTGTVEMEAGGVVSHYGPGDTYYIAEGVPHEARISGGCTGIDVFADAHRYEPAP
jgi:quercetin dioxygenase-like cupin family protein